MGFVGSAVAVATFRALRRLNETAALFVAGWLAVNVAAAILAIVLGLQPRIAHRPDGTPLYFPFGLAVTLPALMVPHAIAGIGEGMLTIMTYRFVTRLRRRGGR
jgi:cobalt/nickel transport system permease protein